MYGWGVNKAEWWMTREAGGERYTSSWCITEVLNIQWHCTDTQICTGVSRFLWNTKSAIQANNDSGTNISIIQGTQLRSDSEGKQTQTYSFVFAAVLQNGSMNIRFWSAVSCEKTNKTSNQVLKPQTWLKVSNWNRILVTCFVSCKKVEASTAFYFKNKWNFSTCVR